MIIYKLAFPGNEKKNLHLNTKNIVTRKQLQNQLED